MVSEGHDERIRPEKRKTEHDPQANWVCYSDDRYQSLRRINTRDTCYFQVNLLPKRRIIPMAKATAR